ncbi:two-component response regulator [Candidatus Jettenia caeni]|uniref:Two-component response regulator n=1 Tax=Candidatus Jettenia caeni TaxID=247490 RepID=I3IJW4_9BACT|nr:diguanylate cyclase/phosphodiesterase [Candidatus Jettenia caeni]NUN22384.1 EAL domain-containing protein [Candidatus Jettenia caeni]WKZ17276.1 MAG: EAL domain-containing protein [Candidatus Jettenia caeni]GAB62009.1 two-component response regulator [Candidatus Jettenia caeni]GIL21065.1 MAG: hypothetical protein BroJett041_21790 [Candidatus Jettenia caeni]
MKLDTKHTIDYPKDTDNYVYAIVEMVRGPFIILDGKLQVTMANQSFHRMFNTTKEETENKHIYELGNGQWNIPRLRMLLEELLLKNMQFRDFTIEHNFPNIGYKMMLFNACKIYKKDKQVEMVLLTIEDITRIKRAEEQLCKLSQVVELSPNSIAITDTRGTIEYINPKFTQITGYTSEEIVGQNLCILKSGGITHEEYKCLWDTVTSGCVWQGEFHNMKKDGDSYWTDVCISPIRNSEKDIINFLVIMEEITERKHCETHLMYLADKDPLTNLFNRRRFHKELERWVAHAQRYGTNGALFFLDLDNFKHINDTFGHQVGDELLIKFANLLREQMRETDILARLGGDEFAIIIPYADEGKARSVSRKIMGLMRDNILINEIQPLGISVSIGIVLFPEHGNEVETLLTYADLAMYSAKEEGRNRACIFSPAHKIQFETRLIWERRIRDAIKNNQFVLHLQPILSVRHSMISGYEALLRMVDEKGELVTPINFLTIAERFGLIREIDRWVIRNGIHLITEYQFAKRGLLINFNLSSKSFSDSELVFLIKQELAKTNINPRCLVFEITETAIIENMVKAQYFIKSLKAIGCRFALDDFGTGFSSFSHLKHFPIDYLKIDSSFIFDLPYNSASQHLVKAMVEVACGLGIQTVAEGVDCRNTMQILREFGVNYAQGYYIGRPSKISEIF